MQVQGQGLGIIIWALAKICYEPVKIRALLQAFAQEAIDRLTEGVPKNEPNLKLGPQSLSNMVYAYAVMGHQPGNELLAAVAQGVQGQLRDFSPQVGPMLAWESACLQFAQHAMSLARRPAKCLALRRTPPSLSDSAFQL